MLQLIVILLIFVFLVWVTFKLADYAIAILPIFGIVGTFVFLIIFCAESLVVNSDFDRFAAERQAIVAKMEIANTCGEAAFKYEMITEAINWNNKLQSQIRTNSLWLFDPTVSDGVLNLEPIPVFQNQ